MAVTGQYDSEINLAHDTVAFFLFATQAEAFSGWTLSTLPIASAPGSPTAAYLIVDAPFYDDGANTDSGMAYVLPFGLNKLSELDTADGSKDYKVDLDHVTLPLKLVGLHDDSYLGIQRAPFAIDFNFDGKQDLYVSDYGTDYSATASSYGVFYTPSWGGTVPVGGAPVLADGAKLVGPKGKGGITVYDRGDVLVAGHDALITATTGLGVNVIDLTGHNFKGSVPLSMDDAAIHIAFAGGVRVAAGDVDGDGRGDLISSTSDGNAAYVFTDLAGLDAADGTADGEAVLASTNGTNGTKLTGFGTFNVNGMPVATGDFDSDGRTDVIVASVTDTTNSNSNIGTVRVFLGSSFTGQATIDSSTLNGATGFAVKGPTPANPLIADNFGKTIAVGDVNNDGFDDLLIGAPGVNTGRGGLFVVFGKASGFDANIDLATLDGNNGFRVDGEDVPGGGLGTAVVVGDFTGDGLNDIAVSADQTSTGASHGGSTYIIKGVDPNGSVTRIGTAIANIISGGASGDTVSGLDGNDWLNGRGGKDNVLGGNGKDQLFGGKGKDTVTGGAGRDQLAGGDGGKGEKSDGNDKFVFTDISDSGKTVAKADLVLDFLAGHDKIDVHLIDAKPGGADNHFDFIGGAAFTKAGQIRVVAHGNDTEIQFNTVGKSGTDMMIVLDNVKPDALHVGDFIV